MKGNTGQAEEGKIAASAIESILQEREPIHGNVTLKEKDIRQYFPKRYTRRQMEQLPFPCWSSGQRCGGKRIVDRGVDILPFNALLAILDVALMNAMCRESILKGVIVKNALLGSDYALIPVEVHYLWFESLFPAGSAKNPKQACISNALTGR